MSPKRRLCKIAVLLETVGRLQVYNLRQGPSPIPRALSTRAINS